MFKKSLVGTVCTETGRPIRFKVTAGVGLNEHTTVNDEK